MHKTGGFSKTLTEQPVPGKPQFVGPQTEAQYREMDMSYLPHSLEPRARELLHESIESKLSSMAISLKVDISELNHSEMYDLRRRVFATRLRNHRV
jgi:hypothetical protein